MTALVFALRGLSLIVVAVLLVFGLRRLVLLLALLRPQRPLPPAGMLPEVLLLVPARDEAASLPQLFPALDQLDYPRDRLRVVLIDDGSTDATGVLMRSAAQAFSNWYYLDLPANVGKAAALNRAIAEHDFGDIIYIFDADHRPWSDCLRVAVRAFDDPEVSAVSGRMLIGNWYASPTAFYVKVESMVHQLVTMRGKDVLGLAPALLGANNGIRRGALRAGEGFRAGSLLEDSDLTLQLYRAGQRVRFVPQAVSVHEAPADIGNYVRQHLRWGRGFYDVARTNVRALLRDARLPLRLRVELALFSLGYLDRLALLAAFALLFADLLIGARAWPLLLIGIATGLGLPLLHVVGAFAFERVPRAMWLQLPLVPLFFALDVGVAVWAALATLLDRPRVWRRTEHVGT